MQCVLFTFQTKKDPMSVRYKRRRVRTKRGNFRNRRVGTLTRVPYNQKYAISVFALSGLYCSGFFFQSTRTDQNSSWKFYDTLRCQIGPFDLRKLTKGVVPFSSVTYNTGRGHGSPFQFFAIVKLFSKKSFSLKGLFQFFDVLRQNECWKIPKGPPFSCFSALTLFFESFFSI